MQTPNMWYRLLLQCELLGYMAVTILTIANSGELKAQITYLYMNKLNTCISGTIKHLIVIYI